MRQRRNRRGADQGHPQGAPRRDGAVRPGRWAPCLGGWFAYRAGPIAWGGSLPAASPPSTPPKTTTLPPPAPPNRHPPTPGTRPSDAPRTARAPTYPTPKQTAAAPPEIVSAAFYPGSEPAFMVANAIFRMGGAAALLSSRPSDARRAKYALVAAERAHTGADAGAYGCMAWRPDGSGVNGVCVLEGGGRAVLFGLAAGRGRACLPGLAPRLLWILQDLVVGLLLGSRVRV